MRIDRRSRRTLVALTCIASACARITHTSAVPAAASVIVVANGRWLHDDGRFVAETRYIVDGVLRDRAPGRVSATMNLRGGYVIPPFGEAHNHNIADEKGIDVRITRYLRDGVFYVENPSNLPSARAGLAGRVNVPTGVDAIFSNGGITGSGGHPIEIVARNISRGTWTSAAGEGQFYWTVNDTAELARKWPAIVAQHPDFIKVFLLYSEQYERRRMDTAAFGWQGLNPAILPDVVHRAHDAGLRVAAHIETASDFRSAIVAGVDQIAHMPGFRGDEHVKLPDPGIYRLTDADARETMRRGIVVVTTLGGALTIDPAGPDSATRRALDALHRENLVTLRRASARLAIGSDTYSDDSKNEARYLHSLGVFSDAELVRLWTHDTPRAIFPTRRIGRLDDGDEASFLVLSCDPQTSFACTDSITLRVKDGALLDLSRR